MGVAAESKHTINLSIKNVAIIVVVIIASETDIFLADQISSDFFPPSISKLLSDYIIF